MLKSPFTRACCVLAVAGCSHQRQPPPSAPPPGASTPLAASAPAINNAPLRSYQELVRNAVARDGKAESTPDCLLQTVDGGERFVGEVAVGIRPLPLPALDLDLAVEQSVSINVLTAYGRYGDVPAALTLAALSYAPPTREAAVVVLTDQGNYVRGTSAAGPLHNRLGNPDTARAVSELRDATVFVAAEAELPLAKLRELLTLLSAQGTSVALAVNLAPNTSLPAPSAAGEPLCPDGLPETSAAVGDLPLSQITPSVTSLRESASDCLASANARGAAGGRFSLAIRVAANGGVENSCVIADDTGDVGLRSCVLAATRKLTFPAPKPAGSVDLQLPLTINTQHRPAPHAICSAAPTAQ